MPTQAIMHLRRLAFLILLGTTSAACGQATDRSDSSELSHDGIDQGRFAASAATTEAAGVTRWETTATEFNGYDADERKIVSLKYRVTHEPQTDIVDILLDEPGRRSALSIALQRESNGGVVATVLHKDVPDVEATARLLAFLEEDFTAALKHSSASSSLAAQTLFPTDIDLTHPVSCEEYGKRVDIVKLSRRGVYIDKEGKVVNAEFVNCYLVK